MRLWILSISVAAGVLGFAVMFGWALRLQPLVQVIPGSSSMTLCTALLFVLSGAALGLAGEGRAATATRALAAAVTVLSGAVLLQHAAGLDLGLDLPRLHDWIVDGNPHPGRTAAYTGSAFLALGLGVLALAAPGRQWRFLAAELAGGFMVAVGSLNFLGYALRLEDLFELLQVNRMAPHTSAGAVVLGAGLLLAARDQGASRAVAPPSQRILATAIALLAAACVLAGGVVFGLMQQNLQQSAGALLRDTLEGRREHLRSLLELRASEGHVAKTPSSDGAISLVTK